MNRAARFVWAFIGTAAMQKGPLWWAGHHVNHHRFADRDGDPHSPMVSGFYYAHIGWFLNDAKHDRLEATNPVIRDFSKVPEIAWLERYFFVPPLLLALAMFFAGGMPWLVWGFCLPTMTLAHATFAINTVNHMFGSRRFETIDESRNNAVHRVLRGGRRAGTTTITAISAPRATASTGGSSTSTWYVIRVDGGRRPGVGHSARCRSGSTTEARAAKAQRATRTMPSIVDAVPMALELAEETE